MVRRPGRRHSPSGLADDVARSSPSPRTVPSPAPARPSPSLPRPMADNSPTPRRGHLDVPVRRRPSKGDQPRRGGDHTVFGIGKREWWGPTTPRAQPSRRNAVISLLNPRRRQPGHHQSRRRPYACPSPVLQGTPRRCQAAERRCRRGRMLPRRSLAAPSRRVGLTAALQPGDLMDAVPPARQTTQPASMSSAARTDLKRSCKLTVIN